MPDVRRVREVRAMKPKVSMGMVNIADIKLSGRNPRKMTEAERDKLRRSIQEFGFTDPVTVDRNVVLIDGYHRLNLAWELGIQSIPVFIVDVKEDKRQLLGMALNRLFGLAPLVPNG